MFDKTGVIFQLLAVNQITASIGLWGPAGDEWSADLDFSSAVENLTLLYRLAVDLADSERWPSWKPTSEFGAVRDRSAASRE